MAAKRSKKGFVEELKKEFSTYGLALIPIAIGINWAGGFLAQSLRLPLWLDTIGTMIAAVLAGPWVGLVAGGTTNLVKNLTFDPIGAVYGIVNAAVGLIVGYMYKAGKYTEKSNWLEVLGTGLLLAFVATIISAPITVYFFGGVTGAGADLITAMILGTGETMGLLTAVFGSELVTDVLDKVLSVFIVFAVMKKIPSRMLRNK
jgi:energy-coupling factor transport system substrate-specific component